jgi:hypothetical protein
MGLRNLRKEFGVAVGAGEAAIRVNTDEIDDAVRTMRDVCKKHGWEMRVYDPYAGVVWYVGSAPSKPKKSEGGGPAAILNQMAAQSIPLPIQALIEFHQEKPQPDSAKPGEVRPVVFVMKNFHLVPEGQRQAVAAVVQHLVGDKVHDHPEYEKFAKEFEGKGIEGESDTGKFLVGLMPGEAKLPPEIEPLFKVIDHELPDLEELGSILDGTIAGNKTDDDEDDNHDLTEEARTQVCRFALGLTRLQAEGVFSASLVQFGHIVPKYVWEEKSRVLNKEGLVELHQGTEKFRDVAGLEGAKAVVKKLLSTMTAGISDPDCRAKGALFCGPPGVGKSLIAKAAGNELGLPTLMVHPGNWMGSLVGESEARTRKGFQIIRAHAPCVAVVDEVEKVMPKSRGHQGDGGVGARMEGSFLTAMNDIVEPVFWVFTANDVKNMHEAFFRAERIDASFYVKLPDASARAAVWKLYLRKFFPEEVDGKKFDLHLSLDFKDLAAQYGRVKKPDQSAWARKFAACLQATPVADREKAMAAIEDDDELVAAVGKMTVDDDGWTPAEIRACCRLSRLLEQPLAKTARMIRPVSVSASGVIDKLEEWAAEAALDAETGEVYAGLPAAEGDEGDGGGRRKAGDSDRVKVRRKVRRVQ